MILGKCPVSGGKCEKECASVEVEDEVECECGCRRKECGEKAEWMSDSCDCECKDSDGMAECVEGGNVWDSTQCQCVCSATLSCMPGMEYDQDTCSCHPVVTAHDSDITVITVIRWEYIVITILSIILIIFMLIIISLLFKINNLRRNVGFVPDNLYSDNCKGRVHLHNSSIESDQYTDSSFYSDQSGYRIQSPSPHKHSSDQLGSLLGHQHGT